MDLLLFLIIGIGSGLLHFGGLWGSVQNLRGENPRLALALSFAVRLTTVGVTIGVLVVAGAAPRDC